MEKASFKQILSTDFEELFQNVQKVMVLKIFNYYNIQLSNQVVNLKTTEIIFHTNSLLSFSIYCEQMEIVFVYTRFRLTYLFSNGIFHPKVPKTSITGEIYPYHSFH